jgi:ABC-type lipoprotein release transport system permease subunit
MLLKIAWRNIWRHKTRSIVILVAVAIGLWAGIFLMAFYNGMVEQRIRSAIETEISHIQVHHPDFRKDHDLKYALPNGQGIVQALKQESSIKTVSGRLIIYGMAASAAGSAGVNINGVMPETEAALTQLPGKILSGNYFSGKAKNEILIGEKLAKKLKLQLQSKTILTFTDINGNIASGAFRIAGIYKTVNTPYDESNVFVRAEDAGQLAGMPGELNEIALLLNEDNDADIVAERLSKKFPSFEILTWMDISPEMQLLVTAMDQMMLFYMGIILLALAFGIINTMLMSVLERTREIGMLLSLGMNRLRIFGMILLETVFLVMAGFPAGLIPAFITIMYTRNKGINLAVFSDTFSSFGYSNVVFPSLTIAQFGMVLVMVVITALLSALFPARRALKLKPAEAIRK